MYDSQLFLYSFWRQAIAYSFFFVACLLAFVLRGQGDRVPECKDSNSTHTNTTDHLADSLTYFTIATLESTNASEFDTQSIGFTGDPGTN